MRELLGHVNAMNVAIAYSFVVLSFSLTIDRAAYERGSSLESVCTLLAIVNVVGLWLGILLQKAIP